MDPLGRARDLLGQAGVVLGDTAVERLHRLEDLVREWNPVVSLVSSGDLARLEERHVVDALSLAPVLRHFRVDGGLLLDVGSGAGFPAIPLRVVLPELRVVMAERSERKVGFLRKAVGALKLDGVEIRLGEFPQVAAGLRPDVVTARAVERPERVLLGAKPLIEAGAIFLCQAGNPREVAPKMFHVEPSSVRFHVEHWQDAWSDQGLRRGELYAVQSAACRKSPSPTPSDPSRSRPG